MIKYVLKSATGPYAGKFVDRHEANHTENIMDARLYDDERTAKNSAEVDWDEKVVKVEITVKEVSDGN